MSRRRLLDAAATAAGAALWTGGMALVAFCLFTDAPDGHTQREALAALADALLALFR